MLLDDFDLSYEDYDEVSFDTIINPVKVTEDEDDWYYYDAFD